MSDDAAKIAEAQAVLARDIGPQRKVELLEALLGPAAIAPAPSNVGEPPAEVEKPGAARARAKAAKAAAQPDAPQPKAEGADAEIVKAPPEGE